MLRVDPRSNRVRQTVHVASGSHNLVASNDALWVTSVTHDLLPKVDTQTGGIVATIPTGPRPRFLAAGGGSIWVLNQGDGSITRVDATTHRVLATIALGIPGPGGDIAYGCGLVWVSSFGIPLSAIDPGTNAVLRQWVGAGGDAVRQGHGSIWLTDYHGGSVSRLTLPVMERPNTALVGTWRLVSYVDTPEGGAPVHAFGKQPIGQFVFTDDGHAAISIMRNPPDPQAAATDLDPDACVPAWYCSYFGTYSVAANAGRSSVHVEGGNIPTFIGTDQPRDFRIEGDRLLVSVTYVAGGTTVHADRVLQRAR